MAIKLDFKSLIVPIQNIYQYYPGGYKTFVSYRISIFGNRLWYHNYLFRDEAMKSIDMEILIDFWEGYGLIPFYLISRLSTIADYSAGLKIENHLKSAFEKIHIDPLNVKISFFPDVFLYIKENPWPKISKLRMK